MPNAWQTKITLSLLMYKNVTWFSALWLTLLANRQSLQEVLTYFAIVEITETMSSWDHKPISGWWKGSYVKSFFIELTESHDWSNLKSFRLYHIPAKFTWWSRCGHTNTCLFICSMVGSQCGPLGPLSSFCLTVVTVFAEFP